MVLKSPLQKLTVTQLFIGSAHVEQGSKFVQELLENKNRSTSDVIGQFYGWLFFCIYPTLSLLQNFHRKQALKPPNA